jgi:16S rRNA (guanine527-N7)-methyltransferase
MLERLLVNDETNPPDQTTPVAPAAPAFPNDTLPAALARHGITLPDEQVQLLDRYVKLLWDWNTKLNLTRHTDYEKFVGRDVVDTMQLAAHLHPDEEVLDVGSGGGVPGLVLGILRPDLQVSLCDATGKKARVLESMVKELGLQMPVHASRVEPVLVDQRFDALVVRAVGPLWELLTWFKPHWPSIDRVLVIKGPKWSDERGEARHRGLLNDLELRKAAEYPMPGTTNNSVVLKVWHKGRNEK